MKTNIARKLLVVLLLTSIIPLLAAGFVGFNSSNNITEIAAAANQQIAELAMSDSTAALLQEEKINLDARTATVAQDINEILVRVEADTAELADFATYLYNHADTVGRYSHPSVYEASPTDKMFGSVEENQNSWLGVFSEGVDQSGQVSPELMEEIYLSEFLDIKFKSIATHNPYAVQLYLNTKSQITRGMPFIEGEYIWINAIEQFAGIPDVTVFDFYYLADETHNPQQKPVWTELYWDPAGLGWMVSNVAPVYRGDELMGVVGIDITLEKMINEVINIRIEDTGFAFLMSSRGQAIAFPERGADFLGFEGKLEGAFGNNEEFSFFLTESNDDAFMEIVAAMRAGERGLTTYSAPTENGAGDYFFAYHPVALTRWSVGIVVPVEEVIAPALSTNEQIRQNMVVMSKNIGERSRDLTTTFILIMTGMVAGVFPVAMLFSRTISNPIKVLAEGSRRVGAGDLSHRISINSNDEIETLATTFNQMTNDLQHKINEIEAANDQLKTLDKLKSQFISMASHELRTPLIAIQGYVDMLRDGDAGTVSSEQQHMLEVVSRNSTRLARIVTELLDVSRIEENKLVLKREPTSIETVINEIAEEHQSILKKRHQTLALDIAQGLPVILGDRDRIVQVVINLLGNAIKYTPDGGHIQIKAHLEDPNIHLQVTDNGIGIKSEHFDKIFSRFYEIGEVTQHKTGKDEFMAGGTGLGLPIVKGIVEAHGGQVWVESEYGQGSTFHVTLPISTEAGVSVAAELPEVEEADIFKATEFEAKNGAAQPTISQQGRLKILVIDDEIDAIEVTKRMLREWYDVEGASTSGHGLKAAITDKPDLVLLDAWMPGITGYEVCRALKGNPTAREIPIIMVTAAAQKEDEEKARAAGANGFISKPFRKDDLVKVIEGFRK